MSDIRLDDNNNVILEGNVGIGTNNPARPLHVEGGLEVHSGGSGGGFSFSDRNKPNFVNNPTNGERWVWYAADGTARLWSGGDKLSISKNGNVGIGTNNPFHQLHVVGSGPVRIENPNGEADIVFKSGSNPSWQVGTDFNGWYVWDNAYRFVVKPGGNVGIGTTNPLRMLHVEGSEIHSGGSVGGFSFSDRSKPGLVDNPTNGERWVWYAQDGTARLWSGGDKLSILKNGNIGIGTTNPTNNLHIVGNGPVTVENPNGEADILFKSGSNQSWQVGTNSLGWYVWDNAYRLLVEPGGNVGIGTNNPSSKLHVEGGEIQSSGSEAGFSFVDRFDSDMAWHWYAASRAARLGPKGPGADALTIHSFNANNSTYSVEINGSLTTAIGELRGSITDKESQMSTIRCRASAFTLEDPAAPLSVPLPTEILSTPTFTQAPPPPPPPPIPEPTIPVPPRIALFHDFANNQRDSLVINYQSRYKDGVKIEGNVQSTGALTQASSIALKENVAELSGQEAITALQGLNAVKYNYKADSQKEQHIGFIAEEVPDLVANSERDQLSPMDLIAVLTKAVQEQQKKISEMAEELSNLKRENKK